MSEFPHKYHISCMTGASIQQQMLIWANIMAISTYTMPYLDSSLCRSVVGHCPISIVLQLHQLMQANLSQIYLDVCHRKGCLTGSSPVDRWCKKMPFCSVLAGHEDVPGYSLRLSYIRFGDSYPNIYPKSWCYRYKTSHR